MKWSNYLKFTRLLFRQKGAFPVYLIFFVTSRCTCRCQHCFYWQSTNKPEQELSLDEIGRVSASMADLLQVTLTGGDAALRDDLSEIARTFALNNHVQNFSIGTNGSHPELIERHLVHMLEWSVGNPVNITVDLSLDGLGQDHDNIRQAPGLFEHFKQSVEIIQSLKKHHHSLNLCIDVTVSALNHDRLRPLYLFIRDEIKPDILNALLIRGNPRNPAAKQVELQKYQDICSWIKEDTFRGTFPGYAFAPDLLHIKDIMLRDLIIKTARQDRYQIPCSAGILTGVIYPEGQVAACELRDERLGELRSHNYDMKEIWQGRAAEELRDHIRRTQCYCYHQCFLSNNVLFNPRFMPTLLGNLITLKCQRKTRSR